MATQNDRELEVKIEELISLNSYVSEELNYLTEIIETFPLFICEFTSAGQITYANSAYCSFFGQDKTELIGKSLFDIIPNSEKNDTLEWFKELTKTDKNVSEYKVVDKNGNICWQRWINYRKINPANNNCNFFGVGEDITQRKQEQEELLTTKTKLESVLSSIPQLIFLVQEQEGSIYFRDTFSHEEKLLMPKKLFIDKKVSDIFPVEISDPLEKTINIISSSADLKSSKFEYNLLPLGFNHYFEAVVQRVQSNQYLVTVTDVSDFKNAEKKLEYQSSHDFLTGLYNRMFFEDKLKELDSEYNLPLSIIFADIDGLKRTNDSMGHKKGDELIISVSNILKSSFRKDDIIARWGGDEFSILLPQTSYEAALDRSLLAYKNCKDYETNNISFSVGIATKTTPNESLDAVLKKAEEGMYQQKNLKNE